MGNEKPRQPPGTSGYPEQQPTPDKKQPMPDKNTPHQPQNDPKKKPGKR
jgi:hypothetical protein